MVVLAATGCGEDSEGGTDSSKVRIMTNPGCGCHIPIWVALRTGIFEEHGIDAEVQQSPTGSVPNVVANQTDIVAVSPPIAILASSEGLDVTIPMTLQNRIDQQVIVRTSALGDAPREYPAVIQALEGEKVCISVAGGGNDLNFRYLATAAGLDPEQDIEIIYAGGLTTLVAAFRDGRCNVVQAAHPVTDVLLESGEATSVLNFADGDGPPLMDQVGTALVTREGWPEEDPQRMRQVVDALRESMEYISGEENQQRVLEIAEADVLSGLEPEVEREILEDLKKTLDPKQTEYTTKDAEEAAELLRTSGALTSPVDVNKLTTTVATSD